MEPLVNVNEAAQLLGLSSWTVRKLIASQKLRSIRFNRRVLVEPREIERLIEEGRRVRGSDGAGDNVQQ